MLSRGRASGGVVGSSKAVCAVNRARPSFSELKDFEHQCLVGTHVREPVPAMRRVPGDRRGLADAVGIAALGHHHVVGRQAARVGDRQRPALDRMADRPPRLDDRKAVPEQRLGFVAHQVADPLRPRPFGVVVMDAADDLADLLRGAQFVVGGAQGVIEDDDALCPALPLHQRFHLGVIDPADLVLIVEIGDPAVMIDKAEAVLFEDEIGGMDPAVAQGDAVRLGIAAADTLVRFAGRAHQGHRHGFVIAEIIEGRVERFGFGIEFGELNHRGSSTRGAMTD